MKTLITTWNRRLFFRTETDGMLTWSLAFSILLVGTRMIYTGEHVFVFMAWNLFLAYIPYVLSVWLSQTPSWIENRFKFVMVFGIWLLFIPNAFYILTDLYHLGWHPGVPLWYDLVLIGSCAWNGLLLGVLSVRQMEKIIRSHFFRKNELLFIYPIMFLNAFGVYVGRYLRFNSWDVITNPFGLITDILEILLHPIQNMYGWGMIICYSVFMTLIYFTIKRLSKANY